MLDNVVVFLHVRGFRFLFNITAIDIDKTIMAAAGKYRNIAYANWT